MGSALTFRISSELEAAGFKDAALYMRALSKAADDNSKANQQQAGTVDLLKKAYQGLQVLGIVEFFRESIDQASAAQEAELLLSTRVEQTGMSYERAKPKLDGFFEALQNQSGIAKDKLIPAFNFLIDKTQEVRTSQELLTTVMGISRARNLDLVAAADLVAGAYNSEGRALKELGKDLGLTAEQSKNSEKVIALAKERFSDLAVNTDKADAATKRFKISWANLQETIGAGLSGPFSRVLDWISDIIGGVSAATSTVLMVGKALTSWFESIVEGVKLFGLNYSKVLAHVEESNQKLQDDLESGFDEIAAKLDKALHPENYRNALANLVDDNKRAFQQLNADQKKLIAEGNEAIALGDEQRLDRRMVVVEAEKAALLNNLRQQEDFTRLSAENRAQLELAIEQKATQAKRKLWEDELRKRYEIFFKAGEALGIATARMLRGQQDAWKDFTVTVIDMIAQKAEAHVLAASFEEAAEHAALLDYAGAAAALGKGVAWTAAIAGIAEAAKGAIGGGGGGGSVSVDTGGLGASPNSQASTSAAAPAAASRSVVTINVQGDVVDSDAFMASLAARLSSVVENNDIRLVSSSTRG